MMIYPCAYIIAINLVMDLQCKAIRMQTIYLHLNIRFIVYNNVYNNQIEIEILCGIGRIIFKRVNRYYA